MWFFARTDCNAEQAGACKTMVPGNNNTCQVYGGGDLDYICECRGKFKNDGPRSCAVRATIVPMMEPDESMNSTIDNNTETSITSTESLEWYLEKMSTKLDEENTTEPSTHRSSNGATLPESSNRSPSEFMASSIMEFPNTITYSGLIDEIPKETTPEGSNKIFSGKNLSLDSFDQQPESNHSLKLTEKSSKEAITSNIADNWLQDNKSHENVSEWPTNQSAEEAVWLEVGLKNETTSLMVIDEFSTEVVSIKSSNEIQEETESKGTVDKSSEEAISDGFTDISEQQNALQSASNKSEKENNADFRNISTEKSVPQVSSVIENATEQEPSVIIVLGRLTAGKDQKPIIRDDLNQTSNSPGLQLREKERRTSG